MYEKILVVVDVQNDFVKGGVLQYGYPTKDNTGGIEEEVNKAIKNGDLVIATQDTHRKDYLNTLEGKILPVKHCIKDTKGWELVSWLENLANSIDAKVCVSRKRTFGDWSLPDHIRNIIGRDDDIEEIRICGYCTSICVLANAVILRAAFSNTRIKVLKDLCGDIDEESHKAALKVLQNQQIEIV